VSEKLRTKIGIIRLLSSKPKTLTQISKEIDLAPSTVSQHLQDLLDIGAIEPIENEHIRKWKYYRVTQEFGAGAYILETRLRESRIQTQMTRFRNIGCGNLG
jgi:predicted transcriptional regulator